MSLSFGVVGALVPGSIAVSWTSSRSPTKFRCRVLELLAAPIMFCKYILSKPAEASGMLMVKRCNELRDSIFGVMPE